MSHGIIINTGVEKMSLQNLSLVTV